MDMIQEFKPETDEPLQRDEIIATLLQNRGKMTDVDEAAEQERQRRMYNMLRYSSHYKRIQVEQANTSWEGRGNLNTDEIDQALQDLRMSPEKRARRVSFSDTVKFDDSFKPTIDKLDGVEELPEQTISNNDCNVKKPELKLIWAKAMKFFQK